MTIAFRMFPDAGVVALFDEPNQTGDVHDIDAPRNAPAKTPTDHLGSVYFHSSLDYLEVHDSAVVGVSHAGVAAPAPGAGQNIAFGSFVAAADHLLLAHSLGYAPYVLVAQGDNILWPGMPVQVGASGAARWVSVYSTTTGVYLYEYASVGSIALAGTSLDYTVLVFKNPPAASGNVLFAFDPVSGEVQMGLGKFNSARNYLQVVPGGSPLGFAYGRTIDLKNGAYRAARPDGTLVDPVPATLRLGIVATFKTTTFGASMAYNGTFTAPPAIQVQAP